MELKNNNFKRQMQTTDFQQAENKQLVFSVADQMPYLRHDDTFGDYYQVLEISDNAIVTERLVKNMPFLKDHEHTQQLGAVKKFWIANGKLYVSVKFSRSKFAQSIKEDIIDLIRQNTSIGYYVNQFQKTGEIDGIPVLRAVSWTPYECSSVSVPASVYVGYNRSLEIKEKGQDMNAQDNKDAVTSRIADEELEGKEKASDTELEDKNLDGENLEAKSEEDAEVAEEDKEKAQQKEVCPECGKDPCQCEQKSCGGKPEEKQLEVTKEIIAEALKQQLEAEATEIRSLGELTGEHDMAEEFIRQKRSLEQFKIYLKNKNSEKSQNSIQKDSKMDKKYFSISKAIRNACSQYKADVSQEYETLVNEENKRSFKVEDADIVLSNNELYKRALTPTIGPSAGVGSELVATDYLPQEFVTYLRPQLTLEKTGYYSIPVNGNSVSFAVCTSGTVAGMYDLDGELSGGDLKFATKQLTPHKAGALVPIPYSLILQARPEIDAMVENDIVNALYQIRDEQILVGTGEDGQCKGILATSGINAISASVSGAEVWGGCLSAENEIRKANIFSENLAWVMNGDTYVTLCKTPIDKGVWAKGFVCEDDKIKNYPVFVNNKMPANTILLGDFGEVAVADFEGLKLKVDDITYIKQQAIQIVAIKCFDCVVRRPAAFTKLTLTA